MPSVAHQIIDPAPKRATGSYLAWKTTTNPAAVGGVTRHPIGFTWLELVRFLYGVRTFRITATASGTRAGGTPYTLSYNQAFGVGARNIGGGSISGGFANESSLVTYLLPTGSSGTLFQDQVFDAGFVNFWTHRWHLLGDNSRPEIPSNTGSPLAPSLSGLIFASLYYPALHSVIANSVMGLYMGLGIAPLNAGTTLGYGANSGFSAGPFLGSFLGKSFLYHATSNGPTSFTVTTSTFVITADNYWPYDPGDGDGPIYNTSTGAQLRSPFPPL